MYIWIQKCEDPLFPPEGQPTSTPVKDTRASVKATPVPPDTPCKPFTFDAQPEQASVGEPSGDPDGPVKHPVETVDAATHTAVQASGTRSKPS